MGGLFGVTSKTECINDLFFGVDYHSHLGTKRGGMVTYNSKKGFQRSIHNIENSPFRTKFERDVLEMSGESGIGCISDSEPQPLLVRSHLGNFAITTVGRINNTEELVNLAFESGMTHFLEMSGGDINPTELTAALINRENTIEDGIRCAQQLIDGSLTMLILTPECIYAARDLFGRTPIVIGHREDENEAYCASFESFAYLNLGFNTVRELGPGEIVKITPEGFETVSKPGEEMKICTFLWVYFGYPSSSYEGMNVEQMRYNCGSYLAMRDENSGISPDSVAGVPDSGTAHAIGYSNRSSIPFARPFIKYTPTWPRSFMPQNQSQRNLIARMKLIPVKALINGKSLLLIDDSIVRGTQLRETTEFLYSSGAREVHVRPACPPLLYGCRFLNFSRSTSEYDLITRRVIRRLEGDVGPERLEAYCNPDSEEYAAMLEEMRREMNFTTLRHIRLDDMIKATGLPKEKLCTYCWDGKGAKNCTGCKNCKNGCKA
ncbi:MAG: amidophosphoribosyltransferase [Firmicutes bacterium]|nr:amidophosphoribosyltransferase [Bacillota bacterium]